MVMTVRMRRAVKPNAVTLAQVVERERLTVEVWERDENSYRARIVGLQVRSGRVGLMQPSADGATPDLALAELTAAISGREVVIDATFPSRRDLVVPPLSGVGEWTEAEAVAEPVLDAEVR